MSLIQPIKYLKILGFLIHQFRSPIPLMHAICYNPGIRLSSQPCHNPGHINNQNQRWSEFHSVRG